MSRLLSLFAILAVGLPTHAAQEDKKSPPSPAVKKAVAAVEKHLAELGSREANIIWKDEPAVLATFPDHTFVIARYRIYPVARILPRGLSPSNIFAVPKDGKVEHLANIKSLEKFFGANAKNLADKSKMQDALAGWLTLTQEFHQDGFFKFEVLNKEFSVDTKGDNFEVRGRALVTGGGNGEIAATAQFAKGQLTNVVERTKIIPGPRPRCQATKLLDADPIVRKMAEDDLVFMGMPARAYILEQRGKAGPELRDAIDRLWERIVKNGW